MILRNTVKDTICHVADSTLLGSNSNRDPDHYWANLAHITNNDNLNNNVHNPTDLGD